VAEKGAKFTLQFLFGDGLALADTAQPGKAGNATSRYALGWSYSGLRLAHFFNQEHGRQ